MNKDLEESPEMTSQAKRRRMLQFDNEVVGTSLYSEMPSTFLKSEDKEDFIGNDLPDWVSLFTEDDVPMSGFDGLDQSSESWLADCFNDPDFNCSSEMMNLSGASDIDVSACNTPPEAEVVVVEERPKQVRRNVVFKGSKSYIQPLPKKIGSSSTIVYPFAFVKPCGAHGDVTLKDINQRIHTPLKKSIQEEDEDLTSIYPTSAFSGKPVVGKTKIRTDRGNGCITIMRTKG
ncbi:protein XRI1-like [Impatiens glandulifera]|uniref:protein XRI1-like n=1 Tax=Impatiens glandulifera TaxID=253017 RepID=UPI001FB115CD|nr:protein XRI1-like [Impatiens glandulifera]